ncbi:TetR/AcrR family transcriptional regulator [Actinoplanes sp. URMC 104]|uniref:TetR/AcrR family transcriptional regulator n=1 Tax=Actinoplanes sp. URMC 104 TaxID=3423409 RepID=UPI003F195703
MVSRVESAAATRRALLDAAAELLDAGGPDAVTLREVGARAGVSRGAPYRHFDHKESLLTAVAAEAWSRVGAGIRELRANTALSAADKLRGALTAFITIGRTQPHLYRLMFTNPADDPEALARAARSSQDEFLAIIATLVDERDAPRYAALLLAGANGIIAMEVSGQLAGDKWHTSAEDLVAALVAIVADPHRTAWPTAGR